MTRKSTVGLSRRNWLKRGAVFVPAAFGLVTSHAQLLQHRRSAFRVSSPAGPSYLLEEGWEGPGAENSWTESGTVDDQYQVTGAGLGGDGSYCCQVQASSYTKHDLGSGYNELWAYMIIYIEDLPAATAYLARTRNAADANSVWQFYMDSTGHLSVACPGQSAWTSAGMSLSTTYHIWWHCRNGSGDGMGEICFSTSAGTKPTSGTQHTSISSQTSTTASQVYRLEVSASMQVAYDKIRLDDEDIGTNPV